MGMRVEPLNELSAAVIGAAMRVSNVLGCGFLEKVYENALAMELRRRSVAVAQQARISVTYEGVVVGDYYADLLVEDCLIVEVKAVRNLDPAHEAQCINYLRASGLKLCLLLNFARTRLSIQRIRYG